MSDLTYFDDPKVWEFEQRLRLCGVDPRAYSLDGGTPDVGICLEHTAAGRWSVYACERGERRSEQLYEELDEALADRAARAPASPRPIVRVSAHTARTPDGRYAVTAKLSIVRVGDREYRYFDGTTVTRL